MKTLFIYPNQYGPDSYTANLSFEQMREMIGGPVVIEPYAPDAAIVRGRDDMTILRHRQAQKIVFNGPFFVVGFDGGCLHSLDKQKLSDFLAYLHVEQILIYHHRPAKAAPMPTGYAAYEAVSQLGGIPIVSIDG